MAVIEIELYANSKKQTKQNKKKQPSLTADSWQNTLTIPTLKKRKYIARLLGLKGTER